MHLLAHDLRCTASVYMALEPTITASDSIVASNNTHMRISLLSDFAHAARWFIYKLNVRLIGSALKMR